MEQIKLIFFALTSFFAIEDGRIMADKTTVTICPKTQEIEIVQEGLFTVIESEKDTVLLVEQWDKLRYRKERKTAWAAELDSFPTKSLTFKTVKKTIQPHFEFTYSKETDLRMLGIWYNAEENQFSINHIPPQNIKINKGKLVDNYWVFSGDRKFSYTIEPFLKMPEKYEKLKMLIEELLIDTKMKD